MVFKLVDTLVGVVGVACKNHRYSFLQSRSSYLLLKVANFCSDSDKDKSTPNSKEYKLKELLNSSSPLRSNVHDIEDTWATSPYPAGTVFKDDVEETDDSIQNELSADSTKAIILFPGQGNQFVGMGKNLKKYSVALELFEKANEILNYNLVKICFDGPEHVLNDTKYCQPATFVCSLAMLEKLKDEKPWALSNCVATCGYSLGELTALVFAGCINFETGLKLVNKRANLMAECCKKAPGGMLTILTGPRTTLGAAFSDAIDHCKEKGIEDPVCATASYLFPNCKVIAGNNEALDFLVNNAKKYGIYRHSKLPVSGAFHTVLMKEAGEEFKKKLRKVEFEKPLIKVYSNVTGSPYKSSGEIEKILPKQIYCPVLWEQTLQNIFSIRKGLELPFFYECGPGSSLIATVKKINKQASSTCFSVKL